MFEILSACTIKFDEELRWFQCFYSTDYHLFLLSPTTSLLVVDISLVIVVNIKKL